MNYYLCKVVKRNAVCKIFFLAVIFLLPFFCFSQDATKYYLSNRTPEWHEVISYYKQLDLKYKEAKLFEEGITDIGKPLHLFVISADGDFNPESIHKKNKCVLLINNAIHPGEPDGVDAVAAQGNPAYSNNHYTTLLPQNLRTRCVQPISNRYEYRSNLSRTSSSQAR